MKKFKNCCLPSGNSYSMSILYEWKTLPHVKYWKLKTCQMVELSICFSFKKCLFYVFPT